MSCFKPIIIKDLVNMKSQQVNCGYCNFCRRDKKNDWCFRLLAECKHSTNNLFVTLTYDNEHVPHEPIMHKGKSIPNPEGKLTLHKPHLQQFHKSLKEFERRKGETKIKYYAAGEYGSKFGRPHYHTILLNTRPETLNHIYQGEIWDKGRVHIGEVTPASVAYVSKYIIDKQWMNSVPKKPFNMMSKGIGEKHLSPTMLRYYRPDDDPLNMVYYGTTPQGHKMKLPRYYRNQIFSQEDREILGAMQYERGTKKKADLLEEIFWDERETNEFTKLAEVERNWAAWEKALKRYMEQVEFNHEKIARNSLKCNSL